jgi:hypothetical protein
MNRIEIATFPGAGLTAEINRERVAADLRGKRASIGLWLAVSLACGLAFWNLYNQLLAAEAALRCAAGV